MRLIALLAIALVAVSARNAFTAAADPNVGTWKLNLALSKYDPGPAPKSQTLTITPVGADGITYVSDGIDAGGKPTHWSFQTQYDGTYVPFVGNPDSDMIAHTRDGTTIHSTTQRMGTVTGHSTVVFSHDGKTRTLTQTGTNAKGQPVHNVIVYERQ
jgi:hypothetical protein